MSLILRGFTTPTGLIIGGLTESFVEAVTIVAEGVPLRPSRQRFPVSAEYQFPLTQLGIVKEFEETFKIPNLKIVESGLGEMGLEKLKVVDGEEVKVKTSSLSLSKINRIQFLLSELNIILPSGIQVILNNLVSLKGDLKEIYLDDLKLNGREQKTFQVSSVALLQEFRKQVKMQIPNIYALKMKTLANYIELMELLDYFDVVEE